MKGLHSPMLSRLPFVAITLISLTLTLGCTQRYVKITFQSDPPGARIYKGETYLGTAPLKRTWSTNDPPEGPWPAKELDLGDFYARIDGYLTEQKRVRLNVPAGISGPGFEQEGFQVFFPADVTFLLDQGQVPAAMMQQQQQQTVVIPGAQNNDARGTLMITADLENCDLYVDGMFAGNTPATLRLTDGIHIIEIRKPGFVPFRKELRVHAQSELTLRATLPRK